MPFRSYNQLNSQPKYTEIPRVPSDKGLWEVLDYYGFGFLGLDPSIYFEKPPDITSPLSVKPEGHISSHSPEGEEDRQWNPRQFEAEE